jgi:hypothetical protein
MKLAIVTTAAMAALAMGDGEAQQGRTADDRPAHNVYVLKGCLTADREGSDRYILKDATPVGPAPPSAEGAASGTEFLLRGVSGLAGGGVTDDELQAQVGFVVEVAVRPPDVAPQAEAAPGAVTETPNAGLPNVAAARAPVVSTVSSITRQGGRCGG